MFDDNYLEKILGEQYNMSNYFENTYTEPVVNIIETQMNSSKNSSLNKNEKSSDVLNSVDNQNQTKEDEKIIVNQEEKNNYKKTCKDKEVSDNAENKKNNTEDERNNTQVKSIKTNADSNEMLEHYNDTFKEIKNSYPDIYNVLEPIVELVVKNHSDEQINEKLIDSLTNKIYLAMEATNNDELFNPTTVQVGNNLGRQKNNLLYDLIKILLLNNIIERNNRRHGNVPATPHHLNHHNHNDRAQFPPKVRTMNVSNLLYNDIPFPEDE